ncbi:hypothetical protein Tco_1149602 [Tanacetum coccineum]
MPKAIHRDHQDTVHYIPMHHRTPSLSDTDVAIFKNLERCFFYEGRVVHPSYLADSVIPHSVRITRNIDQTIFIACIIRNYEIVLPFHRFAKILHIPCEEGCMFMVDWSIASLPKTIDPNLVYHTPLDDPVLICDVISQTQDQERTFKQYITTLLTTTLTTTLALSLTPPLINQILAPQPNEPLPLAPRELIFTTPQTSPHPYLNNLEDLPSRFTNPPSRPTFEQITSQPLPINNQMEYEPFFPPTNLNRSRLISYLEPFMTREQIIEEIGQLQDLSNDIETALHNAQNVQNGLATHTTTTTSQVLPPPSSLPPITFSTLQTSFIPPFQPHLPPPQTFIPLNQSLWIDGPSSIPPSHEHTCPYCRHTQTLIHEVRDEMHFMLNHILEHLTNQKP